MIFGKSTELGKGESAKIRGQKAIRDILSSKKESFEIAPSLNYEFGKRLLWNRVDP